MYALASGAEARDAENGDEEGELCEWVAGGQVKFDCCAK